MLKIKPFRALRPAVKFAQDVVLPLNVIRRGEEFLSEENPFSFHRILAPVNKEGAHELDPLLSCQLSSALLKEMQQRGVFVEDNKETLYLIRIRYKDKVVHGVVAGLSARDFGNGSIKEHEKTRVERERQLGLFQNTTRVHTTPILTCFRSSPQGELLRSELERASSMEDGEVKHLYHLEMPTGWRQDCWRIDDEDLMLSIQEKLEELPGIFVADGHHRAKVALNIMEEEKAEDHFFTGVVAAESELEKCIYPFYRRITNYEGIDLETKLEELERLFEIHSVSIQDHLLSVEELEPRSILMYTKAKGWQLLQPRAFSRPENKSEALDVSFLQNEVLEPIFEISNPSSDPRLRFGSVHITTEALLKKANLESTAIMFLVKPPKIDDIIEVCLEGNTMPPKSTSFEPKMLSGLLMMRY